ncbi:hypothetical protein ACM39_05070 [Chryseobacterium sp. FH2]|uniref:DUF6705 family protein n=1 Tax=Chryseobacterium sp. FH2 TaxID=1674291 RepID=UPI00065A9F32|nr:DUF6705 family protein [Chryseobacterium sp. FH2]KMQ68668.1 hypothetical protein ACM39_05070 [Chryseobacterium sp. FH2]
MKKILSLFALAISLIHCKAQQVYPLNTYYEDAPDYAYMKDLNNYLPPYVGTYKATYQGNEIILYITKEDKYLKDYGPGDRKYYKDVLHVKYIVKNISTGALLQDTQNVSDPDNKITSVMTNDNDNNSVSLYYKGTTCGIGWGSITLKKINNTQISWSYYPNDSLFSGGDCPGSQNIKVYLPVAKDLVFTKQ